MTNKFYLIFCFILIYKIYEINSEPFRRFSYVPPFPRYPNSLSRSGQPFNNENDNYKYDYDYLNNISLGRLLQDDDTLIQQTDPLSDQVKNSIAVKLMNLANRLQNAANILMDRSSRRRSHISSHHRNHKSRNNYNPNNENNYNPNRNDYNPNSSNGNNLPRPKPNSDTNSKPKDDDVDIVRPPANLDTNSKPSNNDLLTSARPLLSGVASSIESEILNDKKEDEKDDKKKQDESLMSRLVRSKRETDEYTNERSEYEKITKSKLIDVAAEVKMGYDSVIKLLRNYLDNPSLNQPDRITSKRSNDRAEKMLENIEEAKKIFNQIDNYVQQQYSENSGVNRNQTELLNYFDKIVRVEKNRIGQALSEYTNQLATNYKFQPPTVEHNHEVRNHEERNREEKPVRDVETEFQNDDDRDLNSYVNERNREAEQERFNNRNRYSGTNLYNEIPAEEKLRRVDRNERPRTNLIIRRTYIPPKAKSRPTRRHPASSDKISPPYEMSLSHKESIDHDDEREYEMVEP